MTWLAALVIFVCGAAVGAMTGVIALCCVILAKAADEIAKDRP